MCLRKKGHQTGAPGSHHEIPLGQRAAMQDLGRDGERGRRGEGYFIYQVALAPSPISPGARAKPHSRGSMDRQQHLTDTSWDCPVSHRAITGTAECQQTPQSNCNREQTGRMSLIQPAWRAGARERDRRARRQLPPSIVRLNCPAWPVHAAHQSRVTHRQLRLQNLEPMAV